MLLFIDEKFRLYLPMMPFTLTDSCVRSTIEFFRLSKTKKQKLKFLQHVKKNRIKVTQLQCSILYQLTQSTLSLFFPGFVLIDKFDTCSVCVVVGT
jgi:hypothetical protein